MKIYCGEEAPAPELDINNAVINTGFPESFVNPKDLWWMNSPVVSLEGHEIRTIFTPRGRIRCTQAVVLSFTFPQLKLPVHHVRTLVLPDDHPDPEVTVIIGQPWIRQLDLEAEFQTLSAYVPTTFPTAGNALEYPNEPSRPWPHNVLSADPGQADPHYGLDASKSDE
ncbi:hypothetical protein B0T16DRAFT_211492 [Cercophora newfieldiana]|uniref:Uncharacterized protein n=1 Tax=Cercophora newfieldiana TaxID=92897 RepID=A0AA39XY78_9PEZI|nr:hypothetical protein B0T16DRAFT_211492 [Cercophora newfieldiana]